MEEVRKEKWEGLAELIYGVLFSPVSTFRLMAANPPIRFGFVVFLGVLVMNLLAETLIPQQVSDLPAEFMATLNRMGPYLGVIGAVFSLVGWFVQAGILQILAEFFGGRGKAVGVLTVLAFSTLPGVLVIPFRVVAYFAPTSVLSSLITLLVSLVVLVWWGIIVIIGIREIHQFSTGKALATLFIPLGVLVLVLGVLALATLGLMVPFMEPIL